MNAKNDRTFLKKEKPITPKNNYSILFGKIILAFEPKNVKYLVDIRLLFLFKTIPPWDFPKGVNFSYRLLLNTIY